MVSEGERCCVNNQSNVGKSLAALSIPTYPYNAAINNKLHYKKLSIKGERDEVCIPEIKQAHGRS